MLLLLFSQVKLESRDSVIWTQYLFPPLPHNPYGESNPSFPHPQWYLEVRPLGGDGVMEGETLERDLSELSHSLSAMGEHNEKSKVGNPEEGPHQNQPCLPP